MISFYYNNSHQIQGCSIFGISYEETAQYLLKKYFALLTTKVQVQCQRGINIDLGLTFYWSCEFVCKGLGWLSNGECSWGLIRGLGEAEENYLAGGLMLPITMSFALHYMKEVGLVMLETSYCSFLLNKK